MSLFEPIFDALNRAEVRYVVVRGLADDWQAGWEAHRRHQLTMALAATPAERLAWLEEMIALAWRTGALPKHRSN